MKPSRPTRAWKPHGRACVIIADSLLLTASQILLPGYLVSLLQHYDGDQSQGNPVRAVPAGQSDGTGRTEAATSRKQTLLSLRPLSGCRLTPFAQLCGWGTEEGTIEKWCEQVQRGVKVRALLRA